nr:acyltransferase [uncultured Draconibacterium sp.]
MKSIEKQSNGIQNFKKIESVQMLRGIAALSVIICHLGLGSGKFGVDLFFSISGFIMMLVTERSCVDFLKKRLLRICPIYYSLTIMAIGVAFVAPNLLRSPTSDLSLILRSFLFVGGENPIVGVGWTLNYEMFFYFVFFLSFTISHNYRHIVASVILGTIVLLGLLVKFENSYFLFYTNPILLEFSLGMFAYKILFKTKIKPSIVYLLLAIVIYGSLFFYNIHAIRLISMGIPTFIAFVLTVKSLQNYGIPKLLVVIGNISYSLYLTHTFVISTISKILFNQHTVPFTFIGVLSGIVITGIAIGIAYILWYFIEEKFTRFLKKKLM